MRLLILAALVALPLPALAADVTVTLTSEEAQTVINDLDLATKAGGLAVAVGALPIVKKLQEAASKPISDPVPMPTPKPEPEKKP